MNHSQQAVCPVPVDLPRSSAGGAAKAVPSQFATLPDLGGTIHAADAAAARQRRVSDGARSPILPDCCNLGISLRIVVPLNLAASLVALVAARNPVDALERFIDIAVLLEPVMLATMVTMCAVRRVVNGWRLPQQWSIALGLPAMFVAAVAWAKFGLVAGESHIGSPAWWIFARVLAAVAVTAATAEILRLRARAFSPSLSEARLQALQARIRPHFLFNSLNTVLGLMRTEPRKAERTLEDLADLFRVFMRDTREMVSLDQEVMTCRQYLAVEQLRLGSRLVVRWGLDHMPGDALLPSLLLQPLVENAVHHGIEPRTEPGEIAIRICLAGERVRVEIINPCAEHAPVRPGNQMALSNVRERLMLLYDMEAELQTADDGSVFSLFLEFPYRQERRRSDVRRHLNPDR
jgi:two-component system sensor histidine kinase AlgZ